VDVTVAAIFALGTQAVVVEHGAFGWDGALAFWVVLASCGEGVRLDRRG
jgi:cyanate permease